MVNVVNASLATGVVALLSFEIGVVILLFGAQGGSVPRRRESSTLQRWAREVQGSSLGRLETHFYVFAASALVSLLLGVVFILRGRKKPAA